MLELVAIQPKGSTDRNERLTGRVHVSTLLELHVPRVAHPAQKRHFLTAQAGNASAAAGRKADILGT